MGATKILGSADLKHEPVWVVEDDPETRAHLEEWLTHAGFRVVAHTRGAGLLTARAIDAGAICLDLALKDSPALDLLAHFHTVEPSVPVVVFAPETGIEPALAAMQQGAYDYLPRPIEPLRLEYAVRRAIDRHLLARSVAHLETELASRNSRPASVGLSAPGPEVLNLRELERMAIDKALKAANGSVGKAAKLLGMGRATLYRRLAETGANGVNGVAIKQEPEL